MERELVKLESMVPALKNKENEMVSWDFNIENKGIEFFAKPQIFLSEYIFNQSPKLKNARNLSYSLKVL